ncbi:MAG: prolyl aminopeptidase [Acidobacteriota bacterium]
MNDLRELYAVKEPFDAGWLPVPGGHEIYYEQAGNPDGRPAVYLHGGPGGGIEPKNRGYFDPRAYRVVLFDQRGCGQSRPQAALENNTTQDLVADMERLMIHLGIDRWLLFGGSWGSTLALAYAQEHPGRVTGLILRGVFLGRKRELDWLYGPDGAARLHPKGWEALRALIPEKERTDLLAAYHRRLMGPASEERNACARAWSTWEGSVSRLRPDEEALQGFSAPPFSLALARIETHYFINRCFLEEGQLLKDAGKLAGIPGRIIQGRYDLVCPAESAWALHRVWPGSRLEIIEAAGHASSEPGITDALIRAADELRG